jgi:hypothetical protein
MSLIGSYKKAEKEIEGEKCPQDITEDGHPLIPLCIFVWPN